MKLNRMSQEDMNRKLLYNAFVGCLGTVKDLIKSGADVNYQNNCGETPLFFATSDGDLKIVKELLEAGADVTIRNKYGDTALKSATRRGNLNKAREILKCYEVEK